MSDEFDRYELVHNPATHEPIGVTDLSQPGAMRAQDMPPQPVWDSAYGQVYQSIPVQVHVPMGAYQPSGMRMPGALRTRLYLYGAAAIFAAGFAAACWFFSSQEPAAPVVVVCPAPGVQVAVLPAECGAPQQGVAR